MAGKQKKYQFKAKKTFDFQIITSQVRQIKLPSGKKVRYWEIRNTWGTYSGDGGYGYIAFSTDEPKNINLQILPFIR